MPRRKSINRDVVARTYGELGKVVPTAEALGINEKSVRNILKELGISTTPRNRRNRKYQIDDDFFEQINSHEKAYVLGIIWGDGNVRRTKGNNQWRIELTHKDREILQNIKKMTGSNHPIKDRVRSRQGRLHKSSILAVGRKKMVDDLFRLGIRENKTENVWFPAMDRSFWPSFILGLSDSDGCIRIDKENRAVWSLIGAPDVIGFAAVILQYDANIECNLVQENEFSILLNRLVISRKDMIIKLRNYLYSNRVPSLQRKQDVFFKVHYKSKGGA